MPVADKFHSTYVFPFFQHEGDSVHQLILSTWRSSHPLQKLENFRPEAIHTGVSPWCRRGSLWRFFDHVEDFHPRIHVDRGCAIRIIDTSKRSTDVAACFVEPVAHEAIVFRRGQDIGKAEQEITVPDFLLAEEKRMRGPALLSLVNVAYFDVPGFSKPKVLPDLVAKMSGYQDKLLKAFLAHVQKDPLQHRNAGYRDEWLRYRSRNFSHPRTFSGCKYDGFHLAAASRRRYWIPGRPATQMFLEEFLACVFINSTKYNTLT